MRDKYRLDIPTSNTWVVQIAGAAAASGLSLEKVRAEAEAAANDVGSMGVAAECCSLPGKEASSRQADISNSDDSSHLSLAIRGVFFFS